MRKTNRWLPALLLSGVLSAGVAGTVMAQKNGKTTFGSEYTNLRAGWKNDPTYTPAQIKEDKNAGRDIMQVHAGFGGYSFTETYSAIASYRFIVTKSAPDYSLPLAADKPGMQVCGDTVEWRTVSGKPFAVIVHVAVYDSEATVGGGTFDPKNRTGTFLIVRGLRGYERIKADINIATTKNANVRARQIADAGYKR